MVTPIPPLRKAVGVMRVSKADWRHLLRKRERGRLRAMAWRDVRAARAGLRVGAPAFEPRALVDIMAEDEQDTSRSGPHTLLEPSADSVQTGRKERDRPQSGSHVPLEPYAYSSDIGRHERDRPWSSSHAPLEPHADSARIGRGGRGRTQGGARAPLEPPADPVQNDAVRMGQFRHPRAVRRVAFVPGDVVLMTDQLDEFNTKPRSMPSAPPEPSPGIARVNGREEGRSTAASSLPRKRRPPRHRPPRSIDSCWAQRLVPTRTSKRPRLRRPRR